MKTTITTRLALFAAISMTGTLGSQAAMLLYEGFDYTPGLFTTTLNGQSGGTGMTGSWTAPNTSGAPPTVYASPNGFGVIAAGTTPGPWWNGTVTSVPQTGNYVGSTADHTVAPSPTASNGNTPDHMWASRGLASTVTSSFTPGTITWMSYVVAENFSNNGNGTGGMLAIGQGVFDHSAGPLDPSAGRGWEVNGGMAIGIGITNSVPKHYTAAIWGTPDGATNYLMNDYTSIAGTPTQHTTTGPPFIGLAKIVWGDATTATTISVAAFIDGTVLTEGGFDTSPNLVTSTAIVDPSTFTNISLGGSRFNVDELRIGTTFGDAIGAAVPEPSVALLSLLGLGFLRRRRS